MYKLSRTNLSTFVADHQFFGYLICFDQQQKPAWYILAGRVIKFQVKLQQFNFDKLSNAVMMYHAAMRHPQGCHSDQFP